MVKFKHKGNFDNLERFLKHFYRKDPFYVIFEKYAEVGLEALRQHTPKLTGATAAAWEYRIEKRGPNIKLIFSNPHRVNGVPLAIILQYGHATKGGRFIQGRDYINPALEPVFDDIANELWREVYEA